MTIFKNSVGVIMAAINFGVETLYFWPFQSHEFVVFGWVQNSDILFFFITLSSFFVYEFCRLFTVKNHTASKPTTLAVLFAISYLICAWLLYEFSGATVSA